MHAQTEHVTTTSGLCLNYMQMYLVGIFHAVLENEMSASRTGTQESYSNVQDTFIHLNLRCSIRAQRKQPFLAQSAVTFT